MLAESVYVITIGDATVWQAATNVSWSHAQMLTLCQGACAGNDDATGCACNNSIPRSAANTCRHLCQCGCILQGRSGDAALCLPHVSTRWQKEWRFCTSYMHAAMTRHTALQSKVWLVFPTTGASLALQMLMWQSGKQISMQREHVV